MVALTFQEIRQRFFSRWQKVMLDFDLAELYGYENYMDMKQAS
jgi:hypothetical protein